VKLQDAGGNLVATDSTHTVTLALTTPAGASLAGTPTVTLVGGVATFAGLAVDKAGTYTLTASTNAGAFTKASGSLAIVPGAATQLVFTTQPGDAASAASLSPQPVVKLEDASGNVVASDNTHTVTLALTTPGGATLSGSPTVALAGGVATFSGLNVNKVGTYTLTATSNAGAFTVDSTALTITPGAASQLVFTTQPGTAASAAALGTQPVVKLEDASGNVVVGDNTHTVMVALTTPGGATLAGSKTVTLAGGAGTFAGLAVDKAGTYTLTASTNAGAFTRASASFAIVAGAATQVVFTTQPGGAASGASLAPQPVVALQDAAGNVVLPDSTHAITLALTTPGGATLSGTKTVTLANGVATFAGLAVDKLGAYTLTATTDAGAFTKASASLTIVAGAAAQVVLTTQPGNAVAAQSLAPQPVVKLEDASGNVITTDSTHTITVALTAPGGATLAGTKTIALSNGVAVFSGLGVDKAGAYTLTASTNAGAFTQASASFAITVGPATQLAFTTQPVGAAGTSPLGAQPVVALRDAGGNVVASDSTHTVTVALTAPGGATLSGTKTVTLASGVATFAGLAVDKAGSYTLTATTNAGAFTKASTAFTIAVGAATQLVFTTQPGNAASGAALAPQPVVKLQDAGGNVVADSTHNATLALTVPGTAVLSGTATVAFVNGVATLAGLAVDVAGTYTFTATTDAGAFTVQSAAFTVAPGTATQLAFTTQPGGAASTAALSPQPALQLRDAAGNVVPDSIHTVTLALTTPGGATLAGSRTLSLAGGAVAFSGLSVDKVGTYTLTATTNAGAFTQASAPFSVALGAPTQVVFATQPGGAIVGTPLTVQPVVRLLDAGGNVLTTDSTHTVTVALTTPGSATLGGTTARTLANGVATFTNLAVNVAGTYTLTASTNAGAFTRASTAFTVSAAPTQLVFGTQPTGAVATAPLAVQPVVRLADSSGNVATTDSTHTVTLTLTTPGSATLAGTKTVTLVNGVATFAGLSVDKAGSYTLTASTNLGTFTKASTAFTVTVGPATQLAFQVQPGGAMTGAALAPQPTVQLQDAGGNVVATDSAHTVTVALTAPGGATLGGTPTLTLNHGVAAFTGLNVNLAGVYTLTATTNAGAFTRASAAFTVSGPATQLLFATQPGGAQSTQPLAPQPVVWLADAGGRVVTTDSTHSVSLTLTTPNGALLAGTATVTLNHGVATFGSLSVNKAGAYTLTAKTSAGTFSATSAGLTITPAGGTQLAFSAQPVGAPAGTPLATQPVVQLKDGNGNLATGDSTHTVTVALTTPNGATLAGTRTVTLVNGVATFAGLSVDRIGSYTLTATTNAGAFTTASSTFTVTVGPATQLAFQAQPGGAMTGATLSRQPIVQLLDAGGNVVTTDSTHTVTLALAAPGGATLGGTTTLTLVRGVATFTNLNVNLAGSYNLTASTNAGAFTRLSTAFTVSGPAAQLVFARQPGNALASQALAPQPIVWLEDAGGNVLTTDSTHSVTLTLTTAGGAVLGGTTNIAFNHGVASFTGLNVNRAGSYTLTAKTTAGTFTQVSVPFTIS
jgi:hypothetical protein